MSYFRGYGPHDTRDYFADPQGDCVVSIHMSLDGLLDLAGAFPYPDKFGQDIMRLWGELDEARSTAAEERE